MACHRRRLRSRLRLELGTLLDMYLVKKPKRRERMMISFALAVNLRGLVLYVVEIAILAAEVATCAALRNPTYLENVKDALVQERERLFKLLNEVPFLKPFPSYSNFILCEVTSGLDAKKLKEDLAKMGVMIRHYNNKELRGYVRASVGKPEHTDALMEGLKRIS